MNIKPIAAAFLLSGLTAYSAYAKNVGEAMTDMGTREDPNGVLLMGISIGILVICVLGLIGGTIWYMNQSKKKPSDKSAE